MNTHERGLGKTNSGRDKNKPRLSLGPSTSKSSPPPHVPKAYYLVVCGAKDAAKDGVLFGDFFGWRMALKEKNVGGDFFSCFPLHDHFKWLGQKKPPVEDIKFGKVGPNRLEYIYIYTLKQFERRESWWSQKDPSILKDDVVGWIREKERLAESGDVLNILFAAHGSPPGGFMMIGNSRMHPGELKGLSRSAKEGVQVSLVTSACYSGDLVNAIRADSQYFRYTQVISRSDEVAWSLNRPVSNRLQNSRFGQACCLSLAKFTLPGLQGQYRVIEHEIAVKQEMLRNITPGALISSTPQSYHGDPINPETSMSSLVFRNLVDVVYDPAATARRRRIEWPTSNTALAQLVRNHAEPRRVMPSGPVVTRAESVIDHEFSFVNTNQNFRGDEGIISHRYFQGSEVDLAPLLDILYWRSRQQSAVWDVFCQLVARGYVPFSTLARPMSMSNVSEQVQSLAWLLQCFEGPAQEADMSKDGRRFMFQDDDLGLPLTWLATMILRASGDIGGLLSTIESCQYLGKLDMAAYAEWQEYCPHTSKPGSEPPHCCCNADEGLGNAEEASQFGFWLPHGIGYMENAEEFYNAVDDLHIARFDAIEEAYVEFFGLSPEEILTAKQQEAYYCEHPERMAV
ncbi:hypothetical protein MMC28_008777 [Mycoblastus sanguinarius]|nr:hypothetical protein [Mycoblastus sanguinarius]